MGPDEQEPLLLPEVDLEDLKQESELLKLQGKQVRLEILRRRASRHEALLFSTWVPSTARALFSGTDSRSPEEILYPPEPPYIERIIQWTQGLSEDFQKRITEFLENPDEEQLQSLLNELSSLGLLISLQEEEESPSTLASWILRTLAKAGHEGILLTSLYEAARTIHLSRRPEAAVRQWLRRNRELVEVRENPQKIVLR